MDGRLRSQRLVHDMYRAAIIEQIPRHDAALFMSALNREDRKDGGRQARGDR